ncbi:MAG: MBL fold metallo-hydrolase, partial [Limnobacter sp.]|nr:MBL fold metallo-hydrolase [Limnobacter sp.]
MKIHHLNCGTLCPACRRLVNGEGSFFERAEMVCHCLLIETSKGLVLVDTGFGRGDVQNPKHLGRAFLAMMGTTPKREETALEQVKALGFSPSDVQHIVVTHLDLDHAGGLPDFPQAHIHVHKPEYQAAMHPRWNEKARYRPAHFAHGPKWKIHDEQGDDWLGFRGLQAIEGLQDDIVMVPLAGHTRGHCAVAVKDDQGWLVHAGDAYFHHGAMTDDI